jgi:hypothetical protein
VNDRHHIAEVLISKGLSVNATGKVRETPLHICAVSGSKHMVCQLLRHGADAYFKDGEGWCPIHYAARFGDRCVLDNLIKADSLGPLSTSVDPGKEEQSTKLTPPDPAGIIAAGKEALSHTAATTTTTDEGWSALHIAVRFEQARSLTLKRRAERPAGGACSTAGMGAPAGMGGQRQWPKGGRGKRACAGRWGRTETGYQGRETSFR